MFMRIAKTNARIAEQQKRSAKNARHKANRKKRNALEEVRKLKEVEKLKEKKKKTFIDFIISRTLYDDSDWYDGSPCKYDMPSAYELAIMLGSHFHWVIMEYDNFTMPDPRVLNQDRIFFGGKEYWYRLAELPCMDYLLNMAIRYSCNHIIIERLLKLGASPNKAPFDYRTINIKLKEQFEEEKLKREISRKRTEIQDYDDEYDDSYYDDYDYYDNDYDNTSYTRYEESHQEYQLIPPICVAAINGMIEVVNVLLKYGANVTECVIEYIPSRYNSYEGRYILMKYNAVDYARHSFDSECIKLIKSGYDKIQSDEMSLLQCLSATRNNKSNCTYIPGIYRHIKKFLKPISDRDTYQEYPDIIYGTYLDWRNFPIYSKSGLHIYKPDGNSWKITLVPRFEALRDIRSYISELRTYRYFYDTRHMSYSSVIKKLPHVDVSIIENKIGTIDDEYSDRLLIDIRCELGFINKHYNRVCKCDNYHNDDCECYNYQTYVDFKVTRDNITISCKFAGDTESQRISNMADYYLTKYKMAINTDIFGIYVRKL